MSISKTGKNNPNFGRLNPRHSERMKGKNNPNWRGGPIEYICKTCGKIFIRERSGNHIYQFCSGSCRSKYYKGILSSNWQDGISFEPYGIEFDETLKEQIRKRDNYTCQECDKTQEELDRKLDVHHIDYNKKNNKSENLISLCKSCHAKTGYNRKDWTEYFRKKVIAQSCDAVATSYVTRKV